MNLRSWFPILLGGVVVGATFAAHSAARRQNPLRDCGEYWERVVRRVAIWLGIPIFLSVIAESVSDAYWFSGWHLHFDRVLGSAWAFPAALLLPILVWGGLLFFGLRAKPAPFQHPRLAGALGFASRHWVIHIIWIFLVPLLWLGRERLGLGFYGYPAATWSTVLVLVCSIVALAFSAGDATAPAHELQQPETQKELVPLPDWVEAMQREGFELHSLQHWPGTVDTGARVQLGQGAEAAGFAERLRLIGANGIAPQVSELFSQVISLAPGETARSRKYLLVAPDNCGQLEALALASRELFIQFNQVALVISPSADTGIASRLRAWQTKAAEVFQRPITVTEFEPGSDLLDGAAIWVMDAATLSDHFMARLNDPDLVSRIGLVVWWDVHCYTGVLAANLWAISRRLHRIIQRSQGSQLPAIVTMRSAFHADAELPAFVRRLLPYNFERQVNLEHSFARDLHLHRLLNHRNFFNGMRGQQFPIRGRHLALTGAYASSALGWPTELGMIDDIPTDEKNQILDLSLGGRTLRDLLVSEPANAGARLVDLQPRDVLAILDIASQGGRTSLPGIPHHVAIVCPDNPYVSYLLEQLAVHATFPGSRRLVGAEGQQAIFRRHLFLALTELEDTRTGLLHSFLWEEGLLRATLDELSAQKRLIMREVRWLDDRNELHVEYLFKSMLSPDNLKRPLDTVGNHLITVRDIGAPVEDGGVRMQVDPERLAIQAYPQRVFLSQGLRYRIVDWDTADQGWLECVQDAQHAVTWRLRSSQSIIATSKIGQEWRFPRTSIELKSFPVAARYSEYVDGVLRRDYDLTTGQTHERRNEYAPKFCSFDTTALILRFLPAPDDNAIRALALALRYILPVHVGIEEDALEVLTLFRQIIGNDTVTGLAIVDLYPRGIGLVQAIHEDQQLIQNVLEWTYRWLVHLTQNDGEQGQLNGLYSPLAVATGGNEDPAAAVSLLREFVTLAQSS